MNDLKERWTLAEGQWLWRRLYVYAGTVVSWVLLDRLIAEVPQEAAPRLAEGLMALLALTMVLYLVAPTAQQLIAGLKALPPRLSDGGR
ncbi:hypothetical protein [uncultured Brevundimonas sp.]|uniref:hypothetical protein n=1 Tax=uncultured Brevundimonas sp. TaxID=213418 RepID=UPI0025CFE62D|nr:hypothetical protein [uncultured Brevundimonas sp.]